MVMLSTSVLSIKWTIKGKPRSFIAKIGGDLILRITSQFTLNQISGQVIQHEEFWDLSASSAIAQAFFWTSRAVFAAVESGKDLADIAKNLSGRSSTKKENLEIYPDPSGDPTKVSSSRWYARQCYQLMNQASRLNFSFFFFFKINQMVYIHKIMAWMIVARQIATPTKNYTWLLECVGPRVILFYLGDSCICIDSVLPKGRQLSTRCIPDCATPGSSIFCSPISENNFVKPAFTVPCYDLTWFYPLLS